LSAAGSLVPHFSVISTEGRRVEYGDIWQHRNLVLALVPDSPAFAPYIEALRAAVRDIDEHDAECVVTHDRLSDLPFPGLIIADRWGEICFVTPGSSPAELPPVDDILDSLRFVRMRCPECEGEWR
jgi:hypothetical protein